LGQLVRELQAKVKHLEEQLAAARKDSSTSSKRPSSDIVKPARAESAAASGPRTPGGPPGKAIASKMRSFQAFSCSVRPKQAAMF